MSEVIGRRVMAAVLDGVLCLGLAAVLVQLLGLGTHYTARTLPKQLPVASFVRSGLIGLAAMLLYWGCCELLTPRTPGKALFNLRVMDETGQPASRRQILIRTGLRVFDVLPVAFLLGFIVVLASGRRGQRIGDFVAHTRVIAQG